jgi:hypothetical protein
MNVMQHAIQEADWKLLRTVHPLALERYCDRVLREVEQVVQDSSKGTHERYQGLFELVQTRDREIARLFNDPRRSTALMMLAGLHAEGLLTKEEFSRLSPDTRNAVATRLDAR